MKQLCLKSLWLIAILSVSFCASANDFTVDGINYNIVSAVDLTCRVTYKEYSGEVIIPGTVSYNGKTLKVISIEDYAFKECSSLTSVTIGTNVTSLGENAFKGCTGLKNLVIADGTEKLSFSGYSGSVFLDSPLETLYLGRDLDYDTERYGDSPFSEKETLTAITIGNKVTSITEYAFFGCSGLVSVTIPENVSFIGGGAFLGCTKLAQFEVAKDNNYLISIDGVLYSKDKTALWAFPNGKPDVHEYIIPESVTSIADYVFSGCSGLTSVKIPDSMVSIGKAVFYGCSGLKSITIPDGVTDIGDETFYDCSGLTLLTIGSKVASIGRSAFDGCSSLESIRIPNSVAAIENYAFRRCSSLKNLDISDGTTVLSLGCLNYNIPVGLFAECPLETLYLGRDFKYEKIRYYCSPFSEIKTLTSLTIGDNVTMIDEDIFIGCSGLTSLTIGRSVTAINEYAFRNCNSLTEVNSLNPTPPSGAPFDDIVFANATLSIPQNSLTAYQNAEGWKNFWNITEKDFGGVDGVSRDRINVTVEGREIYIDGTEDAAKVEVYNTSGLLIYSGTEKTIPISAAGVYIVKVAGKSVKVAMK